MSNFKGTKGKWNLRENKCTIMSNENCLIARVFDGKGSALLTNHKLSEEIVMANAQLIACAPEMLDLLKRLSHFEPVADNKEIEALIKKATTL